MNTPTQDRLKKPYARILIPAEDGTYAAELLEFPGCYAQGDTPGEAIQNLEDAAASWIEVALEQGQDIPEPFATYGYSGSINLRLPRSIHKRAARFAQKDRVSLNQFFTTAIAARVGAEEFYDHLVKMLKDQLMQCTQIMNVQQQVSTVNVFPVMEAWPAPLYFPYVYLQDALTSPTTAVVPSEKGVSNG
jgi:antitoxin HicB